MLNALTNFFTGKAEIVIVVLLALSLCYGGVKSREVDLYQKQLEKTAQIVSVQKNSIETLKRQISVNADIDATYQRTIQDADTQIASLRRAVTDGSRRLQLHATCHADQSTATASGTHAAAPQLTPDAQRAYFRLRRELIQVRSQVLGLQNYVTSQCLK
jgi:Bacteriophage lysis protein.